MALYGYVCPAHGATERPFPLGGAPPGVPCPVCGAAARRVFSGAVLTGTHRRAVALLDATARTASEPTVVSSLPSRPVSRRRPPPPRAGLPQLPRP